MSIADKTLNSAKSTAALPLTAAPIWILTIKNGAAHTRAAEAIAAAWRENNPKVPVRVVEVSEFMSRKARFTHVSLYLWLVKNTPRIWEKIDEYQKRQTQTSPEWFYRRECRKLFELASEIKPCALVATEVGCGEIAALIKRDLKLKIPLAAVNLDYEADRAWIQPEVDLFCLATDLIEKDFRQNGADHEKIEILGVPLGEDFKHFNDQERREKRGNICAEFEFEPQIPIILVSGGGEGLGAIESVVKILLTLPAQIIVLTGNNRKLKTRCEKLDSGNRMKVLDWTKNVAELMISSDLAISKLGLTFYEAMACGLPIIALEPPPGAEHVQYRMLEKFGTGRAVKTVDEMAQAVRDLLADQNLLNQMRKNTEKYTHPRAAEKLTKWLEENIR